jgi:putative hydrolase of HD superfamily
MPEALKGAPLDGLVEALGLKALPRAGWLRRGIASPESVAAHSWGVNFLVLALLPEELDLAKALAYATLHDLAEVRAGDLTPHDGVSPEEKANREAAAMAGLCARLPRGSALEGQWRAYEAQADPEARFVRQLDRVDMALQALRYHRETGLDLGEFIKSEVLEAIGDEMAGLRR